MDLARVAQVAMARIYQRVPVWRRAAILWALWLGRRTILYGTLYYAIDTLLGWRKRPLGTNPLRKRGYWRWLPKYVDTNMDEESRMFLKHLGMHLPMRDSHIKMLVQQGDRQLLKFYADARFVPPMNPMKGDADDDPEHVEGGMFPEGFVLMKKTLRILGQLSAADSLSIWKTVEVIQLSEGDALFDMSEPDCHFYIVVSGVIGLTLEGKEVSEVESGGHIMSAFALFMYVNGESLSPRPINAHAKEPSLVIKVPYRAIRDYLWESAPNRLIPFVRRMLIRIRKLYFEGLAEVAGLTKQMVHPRFYESKYVPFEDCFQCWSQVDAMMKNAQKSLSEAFPMTDEDLRFCKLGALEEGSQITGVGVRQNNLIYICQGELAFYTYSSVNGRINYKDKDSLTQDTDGKRRMKIREEINPMFYFPKGTLIGVWSLVTGSTNYFAAMVPKGQKAIVLEIPSHVVKRVWQRDVTIMLTMMKNVMIRWSSFAKTVAYLTQWEMFSPGEVVYRGGDPVCTRMVLNGRLRYLVHSGPFYDKRIEPDAKSRIGHFICGDWFGYAESVQGLQEMRKTVIADRYTEAAKFHAKTFAFLAANNGKVVEMMTTYMSLKIHKAYRYEDAYPPPKGMPNIEIFTMPQFATMRKAICSIVAVFPTTSFMPGEFYCQELVRQYPTTAKFRKRPNIAPEEYEGDVIALWAEWLAEIENEEETENLTFLVLLGTSDAVDLWNVFLAREAEFIQILGTKESKIEPTKMEQMIALEGWKGMKDFVFLHPAIFEKTPSQPDRPPKLCAPLPYGSCIWLNRRPWLDMHHHVRFPKCAFDFMNTMTKADFDAFSEYQNICGVNKHSDIARIGRWLSDSMVGIVLGGGGAKGAAHLGILEYWEQLDIPFDYICGVSIGAFVGGLLALHQNFGKVEDHFRKLMVELSDPLKYFNDVTLPYTSQMRGRCFDEFVISTFGDTRIEDLWIPFFPLTTDLSGRHSRVHRHGQMWFYIRASMTLTMIFPPKINPGDDHLLMDGGYSEILPGQHLRAAGVRYILAADIGDQNGIPLFNIGYECSGLKCLLQNTLPTNHWPKVPSRISFWEQLNYIAARKYVQLLTRKDKRILYIRPAIEFYKGVDFSKVDEIKMMAYYTTRKRFGKVGAGLTPQIIWTIMNSKTQDFSEENKIRPGEEYTIMKTGRSLDTITTDGTSSLSNTAVNS